MSSKEHHSTCSCTHCIYKSIKSDEDGLYGGSRIDRLYYDEYLPLREKKLLAKLVRTRGIYDDIRNRILSSSSVEVNSPLPPNHECECESDKKDSEAVLKLVELVDRGEHPSLNSLVSLHSDCCGCCRCRDKLPKLLDLPQPRKIHAHIPAVENVNEFFEDHHIRRMKSAKTLDSERIARRQTEKQRMEEENLRIKKESLIKKRVGFHSENIRKNKKKTGRLKRITKSSLKNAQSVFTENIRASIHSIEDTFHLQKIRKDSIMMHKDKLEKRQMEAWACDPDWCIPYECVPEDCFQKIKIREANKLKAESQSARKDVHKVSIAVAPEIKQKKETQIYSKSKNQKVSCECKEPRKSSSVINILDSRTSPAEGYKLKRCFCTKKLLKKHHEFMNRANKFDFDYMNQHDTQSVVRKVKNHHARKNRGTVHKPELVKSTNTFPREQRKQKLRSSSSYSNQVMDNEFLQEKQYTDALHRKKTKEKKRKMVHTHQHTKQSNDKDVKTTETPISDYVTPAQASEESPLKQAVRISSSFEFNIEFSKTKVPLKVETSDPKKTKIAKQGNETYLVPSPVSQRNQSTKYVDESKQVKDIPITKYTNVICKCFPNDENKKTKTTDEIHTSAVNAQIKEQHVKPRTNKHKNDVVQPTKSMDKRNKIPKTNSKVACKCPSNEMSEKISQTIRTQKKTLFSSTGSMKRCFCTLKFQKTPPTKEHKQEKNTHKNKYINVTCKCFPNDDSKKSNTTDKIRKSTAIAQTKKQHVKPVNVTPLEPHPGLLPYECEPGICTPGECDPYICIERINIRNKPKNDVIQSTDSMKKRDKIPKTNSKVVCKCPSDEMSEKKSQTIHKQQKSLSAYTESIKRCFCTLKFQNQPNLMEGKNIKNKLITKYKNVMCKCFPNENNNKSNTTDKIRKSTTIAQTKKQRVKPVNIMPVQPAPVLLPYECEPGFCTTGKCDPYICIERIKIRNNTKNDIVQSTDSIDKRDTIPKSNSKVVCKCPSDEIGEKTSQTIPTKKKTLSSSTVSIKRCFCTLKLLKKRPTEAHKQAKNTLTTKYINVICKCFSNDKNKKTDTTDKTLKSTAIAQTKKQTKKEHVKPVNVTPSQPAPVLLPYECEPGTCTPGKCDPYICIERIKIRNKSKNHVPHPTNMMEARDKAVKTSNKIICKCPTDEMKERSTRRHQTKSKLTSLKKPEQVSMNQICLCKPDATSIKSENLMSKENVKLSHTPYETSKENPSKMTVRISSSFDFNIEFSRREVPSEIVDTSMRAKRPAKEKLNKKINSNNAPTGPEKVSKTAHKQKKIVAPFKGSLKRCFCTLTFQNQQHMEGSNTVKNTLTTEYTNAKKKPDAISKPTAIAQTKTKRVKTVNVTHSEPPPGLLPYECEPGFCTPGKCDPNVCMERIKIRNKPKDNVQPTSFNKIRYKTTKRKSKVICKCPSDETTGKESQTIQTQKKTLSSSTGSIKRCFCTLKFQIQPRTKGSEKVENTLSKVTSICECFSNKKSNATDEIHMSTAIAQTKQQHVKPVYVAPLGPPPGLLPYECEPGFCTPGKCDPNVCIERIKTRNKPKTNIQPTNLKKRRYKTPKSNSKVISKLLTSYETTEIESQTIQTQKKTLSSYTGPIKRCFCTLKIHKQLQEKKQVNTLTSKYTNVICKCFPNDSHKKTNTTNELSSMSTSKSSSSQTKKIPVTRKKHKNKEISKIKPNNSPKLTAKEKITAPIAKTASQRIVRVETKLGFDIEFSRSRVPSEKLKQLQ